MMSAAGRKRSLWSKPCEKVSLGPRRVLDEVDGDLVYPGKNVLGFGNSGKMVPEKIRQWWPATTHLLYVGDIFTDDPRVRDISAI